jgi:hypothetical protein
MHIDENGEAASAYHIRLSRTEDGAVHVVAADTARIIEPTLFMAYNKKEADSGQVSLAHCQSWVQS